jgi:ketosteroid isomerase-like protein
VLQVLGIRIGNPIGRRRTNEAGELIDAGEQVVVPLRWGGRGKASGAAFEEREETWVFTLSKGLITRVREYAAKADALEAAGRGD